MCSLCSSSAAVSVKDSNGTFVSTLSMILYNVSMELTARRHVRYAWMLRCADVLWQFRFPQKWLRNAENLLHLRRLQYWEINMQVWSLNMGFTDSLSNLPHLFSSLSPPPLPPIPDADRIQRTVNLFPYQWLGLLWKPESLPRWGLQTWTNGMAEVPIIFRSNLLSPTHETSYCCLQWSKSSSPTDIYTDSAPFSMLSWCLSCHYVIIFQGRQSAAQKASIWAFPMCSSTPISQFCPSAGGTSWWTTVTQPPPGILMMNSATTFSFGNLPFCSFFEILTR